LKIFVADAKRADSGSFAIVQIVEVESGKLHTKTIGRKHYELGATISYIVHELIKLILEEKPDKIVFDEVGFGIALRDSFRQEIKSKSDVVAFAEFNGSLVYA
jgi:hypothetical protein